MYTSYAAIEYRPSFGYFIFWPEYPVSEKFQVVFK